MASNLQKLEWRLRSIANASYKANDGQCALLTIQVFKQDNQIIAWTRPEITLIEPRIFDYSEMNVDKIADWSTLVTRLESNHTILIQRGEPIGIIDSNVI